MKEENEELLSSQTELVETIRIIRNGSDGNTI